MNESTIRYYNEHAEEYAHATLSADISELRSRFMTYVPAKGKILDAGCGSGRDTSAFMDAGYDLDAFDASEVMCRIATENTGINVEQKCFEELDGEDKYDGIWACASLLHVKKENLPDVLLRLNRLLKPQGVVYASFKNGTGERMQGDRYYHDLIEAECSNLFEKSGFRILEMFRTESVLPGRDREIWINVIAGK